MEKKYQVFISSTYEDLREERTAITEILLRANCIPAGMEAFVATDDKQFNVIKKVIEFCDYYILIIGERYGSIDSLTKQSYTEMEYEYAKSKGIPVLVFSKKLNNKSDKNVQLEQFRKKSMTNRLVSIWKDKAELYVKLAISIMKAINEIPRQGWQRATDFNEASLRRQVMDIQTENSNLKQKIESLNKEIESFAQSDDLAFEDAIIEIEYRIRLSDSTAIPITTNYKELFIYISTYLINSSQDESGINNIIINFIKYKTNDLSQIHLTNPQFLKQLLLQYTELNLMESKRSDESKGLFWNLTKKGKLIRNENSLLKKKSKKISQRQI